ncbi:MAG: hypothetical protein J5955_05365, partial [Bacilli bacterium]|nr:hypothetical protein [Bacilli bacterium]
NSYTFNFSAGVAKDKTSGRLRVFSIKNNAFLINRSFQVTAKGSDEVTVDMNGRLTASGLRFELSFESSKGEIKEYNINVFPPNRETFTARNNVVTYEGCCFGIMQNKLLNKETYDFTNTNTLLSTTEGNKVDVSTISFNYIPTDKYQCRNVFLEINDNQNIYPNITKINGSNLIRIPLTIENNNGEISLKTKSNMYVNTTTLDMSSYRSSNYIETSEFYIPLGFEEKMENNESRIVIEESGYNLNTVYIPLTYFKNTRLFGSCSDSDYCINGGIKA